MLVIVEKKTREYFKLRK